MTHRKALLSAAIAMAASAAGQAQVLRLDPVVVESPSIERDAVVEVLTTEDFEARQIDDFEDLVRLIPGVSVSKGDDRWGASGFNIRGLDEDRVAMNVDGVPQGETLKYEGGQAYGYFKGSRNGVDIEALKAVEIVKGADAILSGNGALAGAVNMTTKDPADYLAPTGNDSGLGLKTEYSSVNDESMASLALANRTGRLESLLVYTFRDGHEFENYDMNGADIEGAEREIPDPMDNETHSALAKLIYALAPGHKVGLVGSYYDVSRFTQSRSFDGGWYSNRVGDDVNRTTRVGVFHEYEGTTMLFDSIKTTLTQQDIKISAATTQHISYDFGPTFRAEEDRTDTRSFEQDLLHFTVDLVKAFGGDALPQTLSYGIEYQDRSFDNVQVRRSNSQYNDLGWVNTNIGALLPHSEAEVITVYALDTLVLGSSTQLRIGARHDRYAYDATSNENYNDGTGTLRGIDFGTTTWTVGVEQALSDTLSLEAGVSTGFRAPTIEEMYSTSGTPDDWGVVANPDLKAESSRNLDVALVGRYAMGEFRVGGFYSRYDDFIDYRPREGTNPNTGLPDPNGWQQPVNFTEVDMKGVELSASLDLAQALGVPQGWRTSMAAAYTEGEEANGDPVYSVQPFNLVWTLGYVEPTGRWGVNAFTSYTSGKGLNDSFETDPLTGTRTYPMYLSNAATVIDLIGYFNIGEGFRVTAGVHNLTDKEYYNWDSVRFLDQGDLRPGIGVSGNGIRRYSEPGRNFEVGLSYRF
ncbi:MAG TPA: TonB-dependent hemoglobin/transferrin/lactoferrin family receptor [Hyphomicrobiales bacterium]|nr:TonB-dependent hemoglobin/transferrin/lactoferrin family receptor [Hyphomicrobiales bacterium]